MNRELTKKLADILRERQSHEEMRIMEVCGTHTVSFFQTGVKDILPPEIKLIEGPGCPVCVTENSYLDLAIETAKKHNAIITTFGDMIRVPSSKSSLALEISRGMDVRIVYSPMNALKIAQDNPGKEVVFLGVGFETTTPTEALTILQARELNIPNFSILAGNKLTPPAVRELLASGEAKIHGFILPGHVSTIIGRAAWDFIAREFSTPGVIAGFETMELIAAVLRLTDLIKESKAEILNEYPKAVRDRGNRWRGLGTLANSGLTIRDEFASFDTAKKLPADTPTSVENENCRCGELLRGVITPEDCPLFGTACTPEQAAGPCMVSHEGTCSAHYKYGGAL